jgi:hypothetical protein
VAQSITQATTANPRFIDAPSTDVKETSPLESMASEIPLRHNRPTIRLICKVDVWDRNELPDVEQKKALASTEAFFKHTSGLPMISYGHAAIGIGRIFSYLF